jgi:cyclic-di-GMP-binding protein
LEEHWRPTGLGGIMHCFGAGWEQARRSLDLGFLVSFAGNLTYPKAQPLRDVAARMPLDGILVETDAPWLAPAPIAASAMSPRWSSQTAQVLAGYSASHRMKSPPRPPRKTFSAVSPPARRGKLIEAHPRQLASILEDEEAMAQDNSFDIVSKVDIQEVRNAIDQAIKEIRQRFDLKDTHSEVNLEGNDAIQLASANEYKLEAVKDILGQKLVKRGVSLKNLTYGKIEPAAGQSVRQKISLQQGIPVEKAKEIVRLVKDSKKKAQASIQGDTVRISSKDRDELQAIIALLRGRDLGLELQFTNYRTN